MAEIADATSVVIGLKLRKAFLQAITDEFKKHEIEIPPSILRESEKSSL